jgi:hypothetical protein
VAAVVVDVVDGGVIGRRAEAGVERDDELEALGQWQQRRSR